MTAIRSKGRDCFSQAKLRDTGDKGRMVTPGPGPGDELRLLCIGWRSSRESGWMGWMRYNSDQVACR